LYLYNRRNRVPLDLAYAASSIRRSCPEARLKIIDANATELSITEVAARVRSIQPDMVVANTSSFDRWICPYPSISEPIHLFRALEPLQRISVLVAIGPHSAALPRGTIEEIPVHAVTNVEPEVPVSEIASRISEDPRTSPGDHLFEGIPGLTYRSERGEVIDQRGEPIDDIDTLPFPAYDLLDLDVYQKYGYMKSEVVKFPGRATFLLASRGCPYRCSFCSLYLFGHRRRTRTPENVIKEIRYLHDQHGVRVVRFQDPEFVLDRKWIERFCGMLIEEELKVRWSAQTRYDSVDRDLLGLMREAGCYHLNFGFESGSQAVLDAVEKRQSLQDVSETLRSASELGILSSNNVLIGLPGETTMTIRDTLGFIDRTIRLPFVSFAKASLPIAYPSTGLYRLGIEEGLFDPVERWSEFYPVLNKSGQIANEFRSSSEIADKARRFNSRIRKMTWRKEFGSLYMIKPGFFASMIPRVIRAARGRARNANNG